MAHAGEGGTGARSGVGGRGRGEAGFGGGGGGTRGGLGGRGAGGRSETKKEREERLGVAKTIGKVAEAFGPLGFAFSKFVQAAEKVADPQGFQAGDPGLAPGLEGGRESRSGTLLSKGAATPAEAVAAQPDAAAKELERKRRRGRGRTQTILAGRKIAEEQRAKTLLGQ